jgi:titin
VVLAALAFVIAPAGFAQTAPRGYRTLALGTLGGSYSEATAINEDGEIVGWGTISDGATRPFLSTEAGVMSELGADGGFGGVLYFEHLDLNADGVVAGSYASFGGDERAFVWTEAGGMTDLTLGGSAGGFAINRANDVNDSGEVVGASVRPDGEQHAFVWTAADDMTDLGTLGGNYSEANAISSVGEVVGVSTTASGANHAFSWKAPGPMTDLGTLTGDPSDFSEAVAVNALGQIVGRGTSTQGEDAFSWTAGNGMVRVGGGGESEAVAVNDSGQVAGNLVTGNGSERAFVSTDTGERVVTLGAETHATALNADGQMVGQGSLGAFSWTLDGGKVDLGDGRANALNDSGQIVGSNGEVATLWEPRPPAEGLDLGFDQIDSFAISHDGSKLAISGLRNDEYGIYLANRDGSNLVRLTSLSANGGLDFSPDDQTVAFDAVGDVFTVPVTGGVATNLTNTQNLYEFRPRYSPDGRTLVVSATPYSLRQIRTIDVATGTANVLLDGCRCNTPIFSNDGGTILFDDADGQISSIPTAGGTSTQLTHFDLQEFQPTVYDVSQAYANAGHILSSAEWWTIYSLDGNGANPIREAALSDPDVQTLMDRHWTPGGRAAYAYWDYAAAPDQDCSSGGCKWLLVIPDDPGSAIQQVDAHAGPVTVTTDLLGTGASATAPVQTAVTVPTGASGKVSIFASTPTETPPTGYTLLGQRVKIETPTATAADPLVLAFTLDQSLLMAAGVDAQTVQVFRTSDLDGTVHVPGCTGAGAAPDPCVASRTATFGGDAVISIRTSHASLWNFAAAPAPEPFVARSGEQLTLDGQPYRPIGLNIYNANSNGWCWYQMDGSILDDSLTAIGPGKNAMRSWFFQPLATNGGVRDWSAFDHTLSVAAARGVHVIATLGNQWPDCDGPNGGPGSYKDASWYSSGYASTPAPGGTLSYRDWVAEIVARYKNNPTILAWQLVNEPEVGQCSTVAEAEATTLLHDFATDVSGLIKSIDPNHLVSLGTIGGGQCGAQGDDYKSVMSVSTLDLCEFHDYAPSQLIPGDEFNGLRRRIDQCNELDKPLLVGELGVKPSEVGGTLADRANVVSSKLCAQLTAGVAGEFLWAWNKDGSSPDSHDIGPGDPVLDVLGPWSDPSHTCSAPSEPRRVLADAGDQSVVVSWLAPADDGGASITRYTVAVHDQTTASDEPSVSTTQTTVTVPGLTNGHTYTFTVTATNGGGAGPPSASSNEAEPGPVRTVELGTFGGSTSRAVDINEHGQVVGWAFTTNDAAAHAFSWTRTGGLTDLGTLGPTHSEAVAVSDNGQVVGNSRVIDDSVQQVDHAFSWTTASGLVDLGALGTRANNASHARDVNDDGQVVGASDTDATVTPGFDTHAFLWTQAYGMHDLGTLSGDGGSDAAAINNDGQVVGISASVSGGSPITWHAFLWTEADGMSDLGTLGGTFSQATAINATGQVAGTSTMGNGHQHAFLWTQSGGMRDLGTLGGANSYALAVSEDGQIVGSSQTADGHERAFSWTKAGGMVDLGAVGGDDSVAQGVNAAGKVVGRAADAESADHAFAWRQSDGIADLGPDEANAVNDIGQVAGTAAGIAAIWQATNATVPGAPANVSATAGDESAEVSWPAPSDGGSPITGYTVTVHPGDTTKSVDGSTTSTTVMGLSNGTSYMFTVKATNTVGTGPESAASNPVVPAAPLGAPTNIVAATGDAAASISWLAPASDGGSAITSYTVTASPGGATVNAVDSATSATMTGLTNGTAYTFTVKAINSAGTGPESSASEQVTPQAGAPPPATATGTASPTATTTVSTGTSPPAGGIGTSITVPAGTAGGTVSIAAGGTTGTPPNGYTFLDQQVNITAPVATAASPLVLVFVIDGVALTHAGLDYATVQVFRDGAAVAACGPATAAASPDPCVAAREPFSGTGARLTIRSSHASVWNFGAASAVAPDAPSNVGAIGGNGIATVSWLAPASDGGAAITGYTVTSSPGGATAMVGGSARRATVTGLTNGTSYTFTVVAANGAGDGAPSAPSNAVTPTRVGTTERASVDSSGNESNHGYSIRSSISADGRFVAFESSATNLVPGGTSGRQNIFVHDRETGATELVSEDSSGNEANANSSALAINPDGRFVAFESSATNLVPGGTSSHGNIFVHDRETGATELVSADSAGNEGNNFSAQPSISADGRFVAFFSFSSNLVPGDTNGAIDVFVRDLQTGSTERVSVDSSGNQTDLDSFFGLSLSADGRFVAFTSRASNLVSGDTNGTWDVFVHDRETGATDRMSVDSLGNQVGNSGNYFGLSMSADGRFVAFESDASNLVPDDTNDTVDVFVHDRQTGATERVSVDTSGNEGRLGSIGPSVSADGRFVAFYSAASNLTPGDTNDTVDVFVHDRQTGITERVSVDGSGAGGNSYSQLPSISADGRIVAFASDSSNLVSRDGNATTDIFVRDRLSTASTPDSPSDVTAVAGNASVTVSWSAPASDGGSPITSYGVVSSPDGRTARAVGSATSATVSGLTNGTSYTFTVVATNAAGDSAPSAASNAVTPSRVPDAPTNVVAAAGDASASVSWTAPADDGGSAIIGYNVRPHDLDTGADGALVLASTTSATITGLTNGHSYTFTVVAANGTGPSAQSEPSKPVTPQAGSAPPDTASGNVGAGGGTVTTDHGGATASDPLTTSVEVPPGTGGAVTIAEGGVTGSPPSGFSFLGQQVAIQAPDATSAQPLLLVFTLDASIVSGQTPSTIRLFRTEDGGAPVEVPLCTGTSGVASPDPCISNRRYVGADIQITVLTSRASLWNTAVISATAPGAPTGVSAVAGNASATVAWSAPASDGGRSITGYTVTASPGGATSTVSGTTTSATVSGLTNGTTYTFSVVATNAIGPGVPSAQSNAVTPKGAPGAPASVTAVAGDRSATVAWSPPASNGGSAITAYTVTASPGGQTATVKAPALTKVIGGLTNGTTYTFTVKATNAVGTGPASQPSNQVVPDAAPRSPGGLSQLAADGTTSVAVGATTDGTSVVLKGTVSDPDGGQVTLQVEVKAIGIVFDGTGVTSSTGTSGTTAQVTVAGLARATAYHWRARTLDPVGLASGWMSFGGNAESATDFAVASPIDSGTVVFASARDGNFEIYSMAPDGTRVNRLTTNASADTDPALSPDGTKVAFVATRDGNAEIYVMNVNGTNPIRLAANTATDEAPTWSPDGNKIAFATTRDGNEEIYTMKADGTGLARLTNKPGTDTQPDWAPGGVKIAFQSNRDGNWEIYTMKADGSGIARVTKSSSSDVSPSWSGDGARIAYATNRDGNFEIYSAKADGSALTRLTNSSASDLFPSWSTDGLRIMFATDRDGNFEIYRMSANGSGSLRLTNQFGDDTTPNW